MKHTFNAPKGKFLQLVSINGELVHATPEQFQHTTATHTEMDMEMNGWVKIHRKILTWGWYSDTPTRSVFFHLLLKASFKDSEYMGVKITRGQVVTGRKALAKDLGLSERQVRTALTHLKSTNEVTIKTHSKFSVITVTKFDEYNQTDQVSDQQSTSKRPASDQQPTTYEECKERKNVKNNKHGAGIAPPTVLESGKTAPRPSGCIPELQGNPSVENFLKNVTHSNQKAWLELYDSQWIKFEILKAIAWLEANPRKKPKHNGRFMGSWLSRAHEMHRRQLPSEKPRETLSEYRARKEAQRAAR